MTNDEVCAKAPERINFASAALSVTPDNGAMPVAVPLIKRRHGGDPQLQQGVVYVRKDITDNLYAALREALDTYRP